MFLRAADGLQGENATTWRVVNGELVFEHPNAPGRARLPTEAELLAVLRTIADRERTIAEYDVFVR